MKREIVPVNGANGHGSPVRPISYLGEAFEGARAGGYRGFFWLPTLDTSKQMTPWTRTLIAQKSVWAYNNIGVIRGIIDGLAIDEVDTAIWPKARTSNPAFNRAVTDRFHEENKDARTFDLRQSETFYGAQFLIRRHLRLHGDLFAQLIRPLTSGAPPRCSFIPGFQCTNDGVKGEDANLRDGVRFDPATGAPVKYRFAYSNADEKKMLYREVPAEDVLHFHDPFLSDQIRGLGTLAPVVRQLFSMDDIAKAETTGQLLRSRVAYAIENIGSEEIGLPRLPGVTAVETVENNDGTKTVIQKIRIGPDGEEADVMTPPSGMRIKTVESDRGGATDFYQFLAQGCAAATLYPQEWLLSLAGIGQGTVVRLVQNRVQKLATFFRQNQLEPQFVYRWYVFWLWQRIKSGTFDGVAGGVPNDWWRHKFNYPADLSVDIGREGRLFDERVQRGLMSDTDYQAKTGRDAEDVEDEVIESAIRRRRKLNLALEANPDVGPIDFEEVFLPPAGNGTPPADNTAPGDTPPPAPPPGKDKTNSATD